MSEPTPNGKRRIDRILAPGFASGLESMSMDELRARRDECLAEREYLSLLRRMVQGRADILEAERDRRGDPDGRSLVDRLPDILADDGPRSSRGEAVRLGGAEEELALARRRVERLVGDAAISDPSGLSDDDLDGAIERLHDEERTVSDSRRAVLEVHSVLQDELKRRFKDDPSQAVAP